MEEKYQKYLEIPKFGRNDFSTYKVNIYKYDWCVLTGLSIISPHPHRYYTFEEFVEKCKTDEQLNNL